MGKAAGGFCHDLHRRASAAIGQRCRARDSFGRVEMTARTTRLGRGSLRDYAGPCAFLHDAAVGWGKAAFVGCWEMEGVVGEADLEVKRASRASVAAGVF